MNLNAYSAQKRLAIFEELRTGRSPSEGEFDPSLLKECRAKEPPQLGSTRFEPWSIIVEFIYPDATGASLVLTVRLASPERIVFLPVPEWVVESIWQGDVAGSFQFESDATRLLSSFEQELEPDNNQKWFGPQMAKRRE